MPVNDILSNKTATQTMLCHIYLYMLFQDDSTVLIQKLANKRRIHDSKKHHVTSRFLFREACWLCVLALGFSRNGPWGFQEMGLGVFKKWREMVQWVPHKCFGVHESKMCIDVYRLEHVCSLNIDPALKCFGLCKQFFEELDLKQLKQPTDASNPDRRGNA